MIIQHTSIKYHSRNHNISSIKQLKQSKGFEGKRIINQVAFSSVIHRQAKGKIQTPDHHDKIESDTFRELFSKRDRHKDLQSKMQNKFFKKIAQDNKSDKNLNPSRSQSKSKSKGIAKSKSMKQLGKKSKSMVRLQVKEMKQRKQHHYSKVTRQERKSESPNRQLKSTISFVEKKNYKSNSISKTNREYVSEITTDRQKSKGKLKASQTLKSFKKSKLPQEPKKKSIPKHIACKKKQQNVKVSKKAKIAKSNLQAKKDKKIIVSQQNSKVKRNQCEQWESIANEDQFLHPKQRKNIKQKKAKYKDSNIVQIPKRKQRLSLNTTHKRHIHDKNTKTQAEVIQQRQRIKDLENLAAVTIQKVVRGYLTRKYIRECFQYNAALNIQRVWRGYRVRRYLPKMLAVIKASTGQLEQGTKLSKIKEHEEYLLQKSSSRQESLRNSNLYNEKWASILQQILSQESVNTNIKKRIEVFLEKQRKDMSEFDYRSNRSSKSSISNQIINNQINSEKHFMENFIEQEKKKKQYPNMNGLISPTSYKSPKRFGYNSPQSYLMNSPNYFIQEKLDQSHQLNSSEMLISNLKNIQKFHKQRLQSKADSDKEQLNNMLIKNKLSPRTHEKKYKEVDELLVNQLSKFNESINQIVTCILFKESPDDNFEYSKLRSKKPFQDFGDFNQEEMITPKKQLVPLQIPFQMPQECINSQKLYEGEANVLKSLDQKSQQFCQYYKFHKEQLKQQSNEAFDSSYQFIEEYLINLIDFVRQYDKGAYITRILNLLKSPRNHQPQSILSNMKLVTESSNQDLDNSFKLPMYKYIDLDEQIIEYKLINEFNEYFLKLKKSDLTAKNELEEHFLKMIADCMNEALNSLRPSVYLFTETQLRTINTLKSMDKIPIFESDNNSEEEMQYQYMLAQTLNKIFYWNKLQWGKIVNLKSEQQGLQYQQMKQLLAKQEDYCFCQLVAKEQWNFCDELVEMIGLLTEELFNSILFEEIGSIWTVFMANRTNVKHSVTLKMLDFPYFSGND